MSADAVSLLGILAGGGALPIEVAQSVAAGGRGVHIVALEGEADPAIEAFSHTWVNLGGIGAMIGGFRNAGCGEIVILGSVRRPNLCKLRPDAGFFLALPDLVKMLKGGDDSVLRRVVGMFEARGLTVCGVHEVAPDMVASLGRHGTYGADDDALAAVEIGRNVLEVLGPFDLGQAVVAHESGVVEIEGAEGTDAMLRRLADRDVARVADGPLVLVKAPKPGQEIRIDMPAMGPQTIALAAAAGLAGLAVENGRVLVADKRATIAAADAAGLFVLGQEFGFPDRGRSEGVEQFPRPRFSAVGKLAARPMDLDDAATGAALLDVLAAYWGAGAVAVSRGYILAIEKPNKAVRALERAQRNKPWGMGLLKRGVGVLVVDGQHASTALAGQSFEAGFAAIAVAGDTAGSAALSGLVAAADDAGIAVLAPVEVYHERG